MLHFCGENRTRPSSEGLVEIIFIFPSAGCNRVHLHVEKEIHAQASVDFRSESTVTEMREIPQTPMRTDMNMQTLSNQAKLNTEISGSHLPEKSA